LLGFVLLLLFLATAFGLCAALLILLVFKTTALSFQKKITARVSFNDIFTFVSSPGKLE